MNTISTQPTVAIKGAEPQGKRPVFCVLGGSLETGNMGVNALVVSTISSILHVFPKGKIFLMDYGRSPATYQMKYSGSSINVDLVNIRFSWRLYLPNNIARLLLAALAFRLMPFKSFREQLIRGNPYLKAIQDATLICSLAGGDSFSDIYGLRRFFYVALPQLLVLAMSKPLVLLPQTLGPFKKLLVKIIAGFIMRHARSVFARDRESLNEVRSWVGRRGAKLDFSFDMAFVLEAVPPRIEQAKWLINGTQSCPLVGLNVSGLLYNGGYSRRNMFGLRVDYREMVRQIINTFIEEKGAHIGTHTTRVCRSWQFGK